MGDDWLGQVKKQFPQTSAPLLIVMTKGLTYPRLKSPDLLRRTRIYQS